MRAELAVGLCVWVGAVLVLADLRRFNRLSLTDRLRPYGPGGRGGPHRGGTLSVESLRDVVGPIARDVGGRLARLAGIDEELAVRLERIHSPLDPTAFRMRQLAWSAAAFALGGTVAVVLSLPAALGLLFVLGAPVLAFLALEQQLAKESAARQQRVFLELPVVAEQLGMLLSAGYSLGGALSRLAARGAGVCGEDIQLVCGRIRQGVGEVEALREWAARARVDALDRLVAVLALNRQAGDLGRLISDEARSIRRDVHRQLIETVERRAQTVWIPVTVATLVPGVLFLAVPFLEALRLFTQQ